MSELQFRSKIGAIIVIPLVLVLVMGTPPVVYAVTAGRPLLALVFALPIVLVIWLPFTTGYTFSGEDLAIRCGFVTTRLPLRSITMVRPTRTVLGAPALSLDRLEITHDGGIAVISPVRTERFLAEIRARCPRAEIHVV